MESQETKKYRIELAGWVQRRHQKTGLSYRKLIGLLENEATPPGNGKWHPSTIHRLLETCLNCGATPRSAGFRKLGKLCILCKLGKTQKFNSEED